MIRDCPTPLDRRLSGSRRSSGWIQANQQRWLKHLRCFHSATSTASLFSGGIDASFHLERPNERTQSVVNPSVAPSCSRDTYQNLAVICASLLDLYNSHCYSPLYVEPLYVQSDPCTINLRSWADPRTRLRRKSFAISASDCGRGGATRNHIDGGNVASRPKGSWMRLMQLQACADTHWATMNGAARRRRRFYKAMGFGKQAERATWRSKAATDPATLSSILRDVLIVPL